MTVKDDAAPAETNVDPSTTQASTTQERADKSVKPSKGKVFKHVLESKKTITADDGMGDWEVNDKRAKTQVEKNLDSDDDSESSY